MLCAQGGLYYSVGGLLEFHGFVLFSVFPINLWNYKFLLGFVQDVVSDSSMVRASDDEKNHLQQKKKKRSTKLTITKIKIKFA